VPLSWKTREEMRECLPRAIRNRPEPRCNKGGTIAVVKSTESLNSWYRSFVPLPPPPFQPDPSLLFLVCAHKITQREALLSFFSPPEDSAITWRALACACLFRPAIWSTSVSFSLSEERIYHAESRWVERNSMVLEVRILTEYARWNCCPDRAFSFCTSQRSHYCGIWGFAHPFQWLIHLRI